MKDPEPVGPKLTITQSFTWDDDERIYGTFGDEESKVHLIEVSDAALCGGAG